jgi:hypothetical protein
MDKPFLSDIKEEHADDLRNVIETLGKDERHASHS